MASIPTLQQLLQLDASPINTDWNNIHDLFDDMKKFAQENPGHMFICADDPGCNHDPPRVGRLGWVAYRDNPNEQVKMWTITIRYVRGTLHRKPARFDMSDRKKMLEDITIRDD